jgi:hypothetical protein
MKKLNISKAIKRKGALTEKAKRAGLTINQFAEKHKKDSGLTGQQSRFYLNTLKPIIKRNKKKVN